MLDPDFPSGWTEPKRLYGSILLNTVRQNRDKKWIEIIEICGYGDCELPKWKGKEDSFLEIYKYGQFYRNYTYSAWKFLVKNFTENINHELDYEHGFGMGDSRFRLDPESYEKSPDEFGWVKYAFLRCLRRKNSWFLAPSFWETSHGKNALILMELGGFKWSRNKYGQKKLQTFPGRLRQHLLLQGLELSELDYLEDWTGQPIPNSCRLTSEVKIKPKKSWMDAFRDQYPQLPNALLGTDLVEKYNQLMDKKASKQSIVFQCGFTSGNDITKGNFSAFNFALRCSQSTTPIFIEIDDQKADLSNDAGDSENRPVRKYGISDMPEWLQDEDWKEDDLYSTSDDKIYLLEKSQVTDELPSRPLLTNASLLKAVFKYHQDKVSETSICIRCGYTTDKIGVFRRAFSKAANVEFGPLHKMLEEYLVNAKRTSSEVDPILGLIEDKKTIDTRINLRKRSSSLRSKSLTLHGAKCAICDIKCDEILEVAHIIPVASGGVDKASNTLVLCANHHSAFDKFLYAFDPLTREICFKRGFSASILQVQEHRLKANVSSEALSLRKQMFDNSNT